MRLVADASIALAWCFFDEQDHYAEETLRSLATNSVLVPAHWSLEVANGLLMAEKRGRTQSADTARAIALLSALPIEFDQSTSERAMGETLALAKTYGLTLYDAAYLELAMREGLPLASLDTDLLDAAPKAGVDIFGR